MIFHARNNVQVFHAFIYWHVYAMNVSLLIKNKTCYGKNDHAVVFDETSAQHWTIRLVLAVMRYINPLRARFFRGNINIYSHFVSFLHIDTMQVFEILPQIRQEPTYYT